MQKYYERKEFLDLRDEWYSKLEEEGFEDVEILDEITRQPGVLMRGPSAGDLGRSERRMQYKASCEEYYRLARQYVWTLPRGQERHVAEMHAEGMSDRKIVAAALKLYPELERRHVLRWITHARKNIKRLARGEE